MARYNPDLHHRRSIRLKEYDYARGGFYFVTVCTQNRECLFGDVVSTEMRLNAAGKMIESIWGDLTKRFPNMRGDAFVVMPNHVHGIIVLFDLDRRGESRIRPHRDRNPGPNRMARNGRGDHKDRPYGTQDRTIGRIIQGFKSISTHKYTIGAKKDGWPSFSGKLWQRGYYDHIIRNEDELNRIREYIALNTARWAEDEENPMNQRSANTPPMRTITTTRP